MEKRANGFEIVGRARKVAAILAIIPPGADREEIDGTAEWLSGLAQSDRDVLARRAGVTSPSETTWSAVVAGQRARISWEEAREAAGCAPIYDEDCARRPWCRCANCDDAAVGRAGL